MYILRIFKYKTVVLVFDCRLEDEFHLESMNFKLQDLFSLLQFFFRIFKCLFTLVQIKGLTLIYQFEIGFWQFWNQFYKWYASIQVQYWLELVS